VRSDKGRKYTGMNPEQKAREYEEWAASGTFSFTPMQSTECKEIVKAVKKQKQQKEFIKHLNTHQMSRDEVHWLNTELGTNIKYNKNQEDEW
jgi:hypothetical protein